MIESTAAATTHTRPIWLQIDAAMIAPSVSTVSTFTVLSNDAPDGVAVALARCSGERDGPREGDVLGSVGDGVGAGVGGVGGDVVAHAHNRCSVAVLHGMEASLHQRGTPDSVKPAVPLIDDDDDDQSLHVVDEAGALEHENALAPVHMTTAGYP